MKHLASIPSCLITKELGVELKIKKQHHLIIIPQHLLEKIGLTDNDIGFELFIDDSNKLTLIGPKLGSQPKSVTSDPERGGFVI